MTEDTAVSEAPTLWVDPEFKSLIPPLTAEERSGLEQSILNEGVRDPIVVWEGQGHDTIVDGHNRYEIALGQNANGEILRFEVVSREFEDRDEAKLWIIDNQFSRRNLPEVRRILLAERYREIEARHARERQGERTDLTSDTNVSEVADEHATKTNTKIAEKAKSSREKVRKVRKVQEKAPDLLEKISEGEESIHSAYKQVQKRQKREEKQERKDAAAEAMRGVEFDERLRILHGGFEEILADELADSADLIFTDPPYGAEHLHLWSKLGHFAHEHLKPGRFLVTYSGVQFLDEVIKSLVDAGLDYYWSVAVQSTHGQGRHWHRHIWMSWKPMLIFSKGDPATHEQFNDHVGMGEKDAKEHHEWAQPGAQAEYFIERFSFAGEVVVDPMCGSATIPIAAYKMDRYAVGCELDKKRYEEAKRKVSELAPEAIREAIRTLGDDSA